ncbi:MAG: arginine repressor [Oscillospiraceae bacterium]|nr:arginine repressor [Oscillospiraceae bacterium]
MKNKRHEKILELIKKYPIARQETMMEYLSAAGFEVTQATISRDIRQLHLVKASDGKGGYRYVAQSSASQSVHSASRFETIFRESVLSAESAGHMVVVKCYSGMANAACEVFDAMHWDDVVGTLSGDDTFFVVMHSSQAAVDIVQRLQEYIKHP